MPTIIDVLRCAKRLSGWYPELVASKCTGAQKRLRGDNAEKDGDDYVPQIVRLLC